MRARERARRTIESRPTWLAVNSATSAQSRVSGLEALYLSARYARAGKSESFMPGDRHCILLLTINTEGLRARSGEREREKTYKNDEMMKKKTLRRDVNRERRNRRESQQFFAPSIN